MANCVHLTSKLRYCFLEHGGAQLSTRRAHRTYTDTPHHHQPATGEWNSQPRTGPGGIEEISRRWATEPSWPLSCRALKYGGDKLPKAQGIASEACTWQVRCRSASYVLWTMHHTHWRGRPGASQPATVARPVNRKEDARWRAVPAPTALRATPPTLGASHSVLMPFQL
jgi:hypothetical protein